MSAIADVAPVLAQMGRDPVGAREDGQMGGPDRVRMDAAAGIPHGGDVIDVDAEAQGRSFHKGCFSLAAR